MKYGPYTEQQYNVILDKYSEENLTKILAWKNRDQSLTFFMTLNEFAVYDLPIPNHWTLISSQLLINAAYERQDNKSHYLADELYITNVNLKERNSVYVDIFEYYYAQSEKTNQACKETISFLNKNSDLTISISQLKEVIAVRSNQDYQLKKMLGAFRDHDFPSKRLKVYLNSKPVYSTKPTNK